MFVVNGEYDRGGLRSNKMMVEVLLAFPSCDAWVRILWTMRKQERERMFDSELKNGVNLMD